MIVKIMGYLAAALVTLAFLAIIYLAKEGRGDA